jgi:prophage tail gpP-like protein
MTDVRLIVNNLAYRSWKSVSVTRSIESISGSFSLTVSDSAGDVPVREEDSCRVDVGGETLIDGFVETRSIRLDANTREVTFSGYDKAQALYANSVDVGRWTWRNTDLLTFAREVAKPVGVRVHLARGLELPAGPDKSVVNPGDSAFEAIQREAAKAGVLLVSDGAGGLLLTRSGATRANDAIVQGDSLLAGSVDYDGSDRYRKYVVLASRPGDDDSSADSLRIREQAIDEGVQRADRVLVIRPSSAMTSAQARAHADWQARTRAARAETITVTVRGWRQTSGQLWPLNQITRLQAAALGVDGDLLISEVTHTLDDRAGEITQLRLVRPDAFLPDPAAITRKARWKT